MMHHQSSYGQSQEKYASFMIRKVVSRLINVSFGGMPALKLQQFALFRPVPWQ
jgi:hypothetical protein